MKTHSTSLTSFYQKRKGDYQKNAAEEDFFLKMNRTLRTVEVAQYGDFDIEHPLIFIFGAPRSGTTLISQLLAHSLDCGFINNLSARFWLAPLHGIRLSQSVFGNQKKTAFQSDYARTQELTDIHEFGYFWRHWLKKETLDDVVFAKEREGDIDWAGLKKVLANMQRVVGKAMVFKNIFGAYHLQKMRETLGKALYIYIERDPLDAAISILDARKKYYGDPSVWWSYAPVEYDLIKNWDYWRQIAAQVYFLQRDYKREIQKSCEAISLKITYEAVTREPKAILTQLQSLCRENYDCELQIYQPPPENFPFRTYRNRDAEKRGFAEAFRQLEQDYP